MIFVIMGAPGAGKGTQAEKLVADFGFVKISTGDLFRRHISQKTEIGRLVEEVMKQGRLVSDEILLKMVTEELLNSVGKLVILDGCPRTLEQARALDRLAAANQRLAIKSVIHIDVDDEVIKGRILGRLTCPKCQAVFHKMSHPPKSVNICDNCGSALQSRSDDSAEKVETRLSVYRNETEPVLSFYKDKGSYIRIDGGKDMDLVYTEIKEIVDRSIKSVEA